MEDRPPPSGRPEPGSPPGGGVQLVWSFLSRHEFKLIGLGLAASFALGCWGWSRFLPTKSDDWNVWDVIYNTLQLFILEVARDPENPENWNLPLHVARFTAPAFLAWSAFQIFLVNIKSWLHSLRLSALEDHYVVIGTGRTAVRLAKRLVETPNMQAPSDHKSSSAWKVWRYLRAWLSGSGHIAHVHDGAETPLIELEGKKRFFSVPGAPTDDGVLTVARTRSAKMIIIAAKNDMENLQIAEALRHHLAEGGSPGGTNGPVTSLWGSMWQRDKNTQAKEIPCYIEMSPAPGSPFHREEAVNHLREGRMDPRLFQPERIAARRLLQSHPPYGWAKGSDQLFDPENSAYRLPGPGGEPIHALVVGFESFGREVVKQLIRSCHYLDRQRVRITIVAENAKREWRRFKKEVPALNKVADVDLHEEDPSSITHLTWNKLQAVDGENNRGLFDVAYITTSDLADAYAVTKDAADGLGDNQSPRRVVLCGEKVRISTRDWVDLQFFDPHEMALVAGEILSADPDKDPDKLAKQAHNRYLDTRRVQGKYDPKANKKDRDWYGLSEAARDSNRDLIASHGVQEVLLGRTRTELVAHAARVEASKGAQEEMFRGARSEWAKAIDEKITDLHSEEWQLAVAVKKVVEELGGIASTIDHDPVLVALRAISPELKGIGVHQLRQAGGLAGLKEHLRAIQDFEETGGLDLEKLKEAADKAAREIPGFESSQPRWAKRREEIERELVELPSQLKAGFPPLEILAEVEHRRWAASKALAGFVHGWPTFDPRRQHEDMISYHELPNGTQRFDRANWWNFPTTLLQTDEADSEP